MNLGGFNVKTTTPKKLAKLIHTAKVVVVQWGTDRCIPCRNQEHSIDVFRDSLGIGKKSKLRPTDIEMVKIDIDTHPTPTKDFVVPDVYPAVTIFKNGLPQPFIVNGKKTELVYGQRTGGETPKIEDFIVKTLRSARLIK